MIAYNGWCRPYNLKDFIKTLIISCPYCDTFIHIISYSILFNVPNICNIKILYTKLYTLRCAV